MKYFKIGCRWDSEGENHNHIQDVFQEYQAIFIDQIRDDSSHNCMKSAKVNDRVAIANGKKIIGVAIIKSYEMSLNQMNIPKEIQVETSDQFEHHKHANYQQYSVDNIQNALGFRALVMLFKETSDEIKYGNIGAFRSIVDQSVKDHIDAMCKKYNMLKKDF